MPPPRTSEDQRNELYLELIKVGKLSAPQNESGEEKESFLNFAAFLMKRILIHHARPIARRIPKISLEDTDRQPSVSGEPLLELEDILCRLARVNPNLRALVEMKVFEGLYGEAIAERLGCTPRTVTRHWEFASIWLQHELVRQDSV